MTKQEKATLTKYIEDKNYASVIDYSSSKIELGKSDYLLFGTRGWAYTVLPLVSERGVNGLAFVTRRDKSVNV